MTKKQIDLPWYRRTDNPHAFLFAEKDERPGYRKVPDPLSPEQRRRIEAIKDEINSTYIDDTKEVWE